MVFVLVVFFIILTACAGSVPQFDEEKWRKEVLATDSNMLYSKHIDENGKFFNPWLPTEHKVSLKAALSYHFFSENEQFPDYPAEQYKQLYHHVDNSYDYLRDSNNQSISFAGHASVIIKMDGQTILTDPFFSPRAFIAGKTVTIEFDFDKLPDKPIVLISHNHYDHLDKYSIKQLIKRGAVFIVPLKLSGFFTNLGAKTNDVHELDWWQAIKLNDVEYTLLPAQHWSLRIGQPAGTTLWGGYMISGSKVIYFSGDTGYFKGFAEFGKRYNIDYALLGAGAYIPRWMMHYSHQNIDEFFMAADDLGAKKTIPIHFGVINLGREPFLYQMYDIDQRIAKQPEYENKIIKLRVGEHINLN